MIGALFLGDILIFYLALILTLILRYKEFWLLNFFGHFNPFLIVLILWLLVFNVSGLYEKKKLKNNVDFFKILFTAIILNIFLAIAFFYLLPFYGIAPRTNLFIFSLIFIFLEFSWRRYFNKILSDFVPATKVLMIVNGKASYEILNFLNQNKQFGYEVKYFWPMEQIPSELNTTKDWKNFIFRNSIEIIVLPLAFKKDTKFSKIFYELLSSGVLIYDTPYFYELIFKKIPLSEINEEWFLDKVLEKEKFYDKLKRGIEFLIALFLFWFLFPILILIGVLIKLTSKGPVIYKQVRVGENNKEFILYKFRTMYQDAEKNGPQWKLSGDYDPRFTWIGRFLAKTHLDELPQLVNILKGDLSFIGPRPERPEFVSVLEEKIPYYNIRHLIKPGITGWAQINFKYGASIEDTYEKLQYDIFYLKNRSVILDLAIFIKTLKKFFTTD
jgi:exopolysaccharide biosynthesis polyprenyl glycosylphosphotransferase